MTRTFGLLLLGLFLVGSAAPIASAEDPAAAERLGALELKIADLQAQIATLSQRLAAAGATTHASPPAPLAWTKLVDPEHLQARLLVAAKEKRPVVVLVGASWCKYTKDYLALIDETPALRGRFEGLVRLMVDVEREPREDLRKVLGVGAWQPMLRFFDATGEPVPDAALDHWHGAQTAAVLQKSLARVGS